VGLETALFAAAKGTINPETLYFLFEYEAETPDRLRELMFRGTSTVTVFEMLPRAGKDMGRSTRWVIMDKIARFGIDVKTNAKVLSIKNGIIAYEQNNEAALAGFDSVIIAAGSQPVRTLSDAVSALNIPYATVGDCCAPGKINDAIHGGFLAAMKIDQQN
jgi:2,4-dienoyl-CoA reductase (NADPH2)